jgi:tetratricopeptide (TPR) repeat protein
MFIKKYIKKIFKKKFIIFNLSSVVSAIAVSVIIGQYSKYLENKYYDAKNLMINGEYLLAYEQFDELNEYKDSLKFAAEAYNNIIEIQLMDEKYQKAISLYDTGDYYKASVLFNELASNDYKDSKQRAVEANQSYINELSSIDNENLVMQKEKDYLDAKSLFYKGQYANAAEKFYELSEYKDSSTFYEQSKNILFIQTSNANTISADNWYSAGLKTDGTIVIAGDAPDTNTDEWSNLISISAGGENLIGLKSDGSVLVAGKLADKVIDWNGIIAISAGYNYLIGLKYDGTTVSVGHDLGDGQRNVGDWRDIIAISTGWRHTVGLKSDGTVVATGYNQWKQCDVSDWKDIVAIAAGGGATANDKKSGHTVGLKKDGTVVATGNNNYNQCEVDEWTNIVAIAAGLYHTVGLKNDGTVVMVGNETERSPSSDWENVVAISAGSGFTLGLTKEGRVLSVGYNNHDQCETENWNNILIYDK